MLLAEALRQAIAQEAEVQACGMPWDVDGWSPKWFEGWFCCEKLGGRFSFGPEPLWESCALEEAANFCGCM